MPAWAAGAQVTADCSGDGVPQGSLCAVLVKAASGLPAVMGMWRVIQPKASAFDLPAAPQFHVAPIAPPACPSTVPAIPSRSAPTVIIVPFGLTTSHGVIRTVNEMPLCRQLYGGLFFVRISFKTNKLGSCSPGRSVMRLSHFEYVQGMRCHGLLAI